LGEGYQRLGNSFRAIDHCIQGLVTVRDVENMAGELRILQSLGYAYQNIQDHFRAVDYYQQAVELAEQTNDVDSEVSIRFTLGKTFASEGNQREAYEQYAHSIELLENLRAGWRAVEQRMIFLGRRMGLYAEMISLCAAMQENQDALNYLERSKSRGYVEQLAQTSISPPDIEDEFLAKSLLENVEIISAHLPAT
jgi:tetratricopeptide (TPR) repeat protein